MTITLQSVVVAAREQLCSDAGGRMIIAGLRSGHYYELSGVATRVWQLVQSPSVVADLPRRIAEEFEVTAEGCRDEVMQLLERLADEGLIEVANA